MRTITPQHQAQRLANCNDQTSFVTSRGAWFRLSYELEDALAQRDDLAAENSRLHAEIARLRQCDE
jgi:hypothetical protein